jgi:hypothetical protein
MIPNKFDLSSNIKGDEEKKITFSKHMNLVGKLKTHG